MCVKVNTYYLDLQAGTLTLMVEFLEPSEPDKEEDDKEEERPDDLDEEPTPVPFSEGQVLPEKQLKLEEESHLVLILVLNPSSPSFSLNLAFQVSLQFWICETQSVPVFSPLQASATCCSSLEHLKGKAWSCK